MRLEALTVALRPRSTWEATDLGFALVRRHAATVWGTWALVTLPVFALLNVLGVLLDMTLLASLLFWWLKPVFDRAPLYVISRAVFGAVPSVREAALAQLRWGWRGMLGWLTWRRLHPSRSLLLPVDLLEGLRGPRRSERVRVLQRSASGTSMMTLLIAVNIEIMLSFAVLLLALMLLPVDALPDNAKLFWEKLFEAPPLWAQVLGNLLYWLAMTIIEPFYVGAGFGLYLNRRTQLEAWDVELAFRRIAARLAGTAAALPIVVLLAGWLCLAPLQARAQDARQPVTVEMYDDSAADAAADCEPPAQDAAAGCEKAALPKRIKQPETEKLSDEDQVRGNAAGSLAEDVTDAPPRSLRRVFGNQYVADGERFDASVKKAYEDGDLNPRVTSHRWEPINPSTAPAATPRNGFLKWLEPVVQVLAFIAENILWLLVALLLVLIIRYHRAWMPWISDRFERPRSADPLQVLDLAVPEALPDDIPTAVRTLWRDGRQREALALFYRAAVLRLDEALGTPLPPGATEAECLRRARRLGAHSYVQLFTRIVRCWQAAAYARRLPKAGELEALLTEWTQPQEAAA
jgi:Domain of unknown function (DUF4129)